MKELRLTFTDPEFSKLKKAKMSCNYASWHAFVLARCAKGVSVRHDKEKRNSEKVKSVIPTLWTEGIKRK